MMGIVDVGMGVRLGRGGQAKLKRDDQYSLVHSCPFNPPHPTPHKPAIRGADWLSEKLKEVGSHTHHGMRAPPPAAHHDSAAAAAGGFGPPAGGYI